MNYTKHAKIRAKQRGFSKYILEIILDCGSQKMAFGGATKVFFGNKEYQNAVGELKRTLQLLDKAKGGNIIISGNDLITVYKTH